MQINIIPDLAIVIYASTHLGGYWRTHSKPGKPIFRVEGYLNPSKSIHIAFSVTAPDSVEIHKCRAKFEIYDIAMGIETAVEDDCLFGRWQYRDYIICIPWVMQKKKGAL
jgi:hypothetical protein